MCVLIKLLIRYCVRDVTLYKLHFYLMLDAKTRQYVKLRVEIKVLLFKKVFLRENFSDTQTADYRNVPRPRIASSVRQMKDICRGIESASSQRELAIPSLREVLRR